MLYILVQMKFVQEFKMKIKILFLCLVALSSIAVFAEETKLNVVVPVEAPAVDSNSVEANLPRTDADFIKYSEYWKKQTKEALAAEIEKLEKFITVEGANARKSRMEYEKACKNFVPQAASEKLTALREKEKQLANELSKIRQEIRNEIMQSPEIKKLSEENLRDNLNVRHARLALKGLQEIQKEEK